MSRLSDFSRAPEFPFRFQFRPIFSLGLAFSLFFATVPLVYAQEQSATAVSHQVKEIFEHAAKAVVKIHGVDEHCEISGTGFFIDPTGTLYTAYTVGGEAGNFTIEFNGKKYPARQLLADIRSGTAMLKIDAVTPAMTIGKSGTGGGNPSRRHWLSIGFAGNAEFRNGRGVRPQISGPLFFDYALASESADAARRGGRAIT